MAEAPLRSIRPTDRPSTIRIASVPDPERIIAEAGLAGMAAFAVADATTGEILEVHEPDLPLPPASALKAITAVYALDALGAQHTFTTRLVATGPVSNGRVQGDLVLMGGGDPVLGTDDLAEMARRLREAGVQGVTGRFLVWGGALPYVRTIDAGQPDHVGYSPAVSGLNLNFNRVHFEWRRQNGAYTVTMDARTATHRPAVSVARMRVVDRSLPVYTYEGGGTDNWTVARGALGDRCARWLPVRNPTAYAGDVFRTLARAQGVTLPAAQEVSGQPQGTALVTHNSPALAVILRDMLKFSTNLTAEAVGLAATYARGSRVGQLGASGAMMSAWTRDALGINARFVDHSGLGDASRVTAGQMARALASLRPDGPLRALLKDIPMTNSNGDRIPNPPVEVVAKTGTLNFVSALAGYARTREGRELSFAIFAADTATRAGLSQADRERPQGARGWNGRAKRMQQRLLQRWGVVHAS